MGIRVSLRGIDDSVENGQYKIDRRGAFGAGVLLVQGCFRSRGASGAEGLPGQRREKREERRERDKGIK